MVDGPVAPAPGEVGAGSGADAAPAGLPPEVAAFIEQQTAQIAALTAQRTGAPVAPDGAPLAPVDPPKPSILTALKELEGDAEHSTFADKVLHLAQDGYQTIIKTEQEEPALRTLLTIVEELAGKVVMP